MRIVVVSDIHINSYFSKEEQFLKLLSTLETDVLVINGDLYDLYLGPPQRCILDMIASNKNIKKMVYIRGNHDSKIKEYLPYLDIVDFYTVGDVYITHGHQYDTLSDEEPSETGIGRVSVIIRDWLERVFKINFRLAFKKISFGLVDYLMLKAQKKAAEAFPDKKVVIGHTHHPMLEPPLYNDGCMVDDHFSYMVININAEGESSLCLVKG